MGELLRRLGCTVEIAYPATPTRPASRRRVGDDRRAGGARAQGALRARTTPAGIDRRARARSSPDVGRASVALPGGDAIGSRGLDMHIRGLQELGAVVRIEHGQVVAEVPDGLRGANLWLDFPSVGATENLRDGGGAGRGHHRHRQRRPRARDHRPVRDARRDGRPHRRHLHLDPDRSRASTGCTRSSTRTVTDRIVAGTWVFASAIAGRRPAHRAAASPHHLDIVLDKLVAAGREVEPREGGFTRAHRTGG